MQGLLEHEAVLVRLARRLCRSSADADDLVQDTFERALQCRARYADGNLGGWLAAILHHLFIDRCRATRRAPQVELTDQLRAPDAVEPPAWSELSERDVAEALARLPAKFRTVFELHAAGLAYDELAERLAIPKSTVGTRLVRARRKLKALLTAGRRDAVR